MRVLLLVAFVLVGCTSSAEPAPSSSSSISDHPVTPGTPSTIGEVDAGNFHTCVRMSDGRVDCWGQCGRQCGMRPDGSTQRMPVAGLSGAVEIAVADSHACARLADGEVSCWGSNYLNLLGRVTPDDSPMPMLVPDVHDAVEIAIGDSPTCARHTDGTVSCWGPSSQDHAQTDAAAKARLPRRVDDLSGAQSLELDGARGCARIDDRTSKCWTWSAGEPDWVSRMGPAQLDARRVDVVHSTSGTCNCDLGRDGVVHCIGSGILSAQLADGSSPPVQLHTCPADGLTGVRTLGERCAIMSDGGVRCWGSTFFAQPGGTPVFEDLHEPTVIPGLSQVEQLALGSGHACALSEGGVLACWGNNGQGQVDGTPSETPLWPPRIITANADG